MNINATLLLTLLLVSPQALTQSRTGPTRTVSGYVTDATNGESLIGVSVYVNGIGTGAVTNNYGFYSVSLSAGEQTLVITYVGYTKQTRSVVLTSQNVTLNIGLSQLSQDLQEVVVSSNRDENVKRIGLGVNKVDIKTIQRIPALLGEVDVIRSIQLLPGVSTVGEGATGFNVRGGNIDQNLVLLDEAPVYNSSHLFGFFSVFNPDAVKDVQLVKAGIPSLYGGRISSVLDVRMKEGNALKPQFRGGIGAIFSRLSYERPIFGSKGSFIVAGRRSYADMLAQPFLSSALKGSQFYFYDLTAKMNYHLNDKNTFYVSGYLGRDVYGAGFGFNWGNATTSFRWNHIFTNKLFLNTTAFYSNYDYLVDSDLTRKTPNDYFRIQSKIINYSIKPDFSLYLKNNTVTFGGQVILYAFHPGLATAASSGDVRTFGQASKYAIERVLYVGNQQQLTPPLELQYGLRYSLYNYIGPGEVYNYRTDMLPGIRRPVDPTLTRTYTAGQSIQKYATPEPRFSAKYDLSAGRSVKISYNRLAQYVHLLSNTAASVPLDTWTPSTNNIKPQLADQIAAGYFQNFGPSSNDYEVSVEMYYKWLQNQIDYITGANLRANKFLEGDLLYGKGRAYGAEFFVKKNTGVLHGWLSYTLAKTERQVVGINNDNWYPSRFDKRNVLNAVLLYDPLRRKRWSFSATFAYNTGAPVSFPANRFEVQGYVAPLNPDNSRNNFRLPDYHRLDLAATLQGRRRPGRKNEDSWVFSLFNAYNRKNTFSEYVQPSPDAPRVTQAIRYSVFGSIIPGVTYNFKF